MRSFNTHCEYKDGVYINNNALFNSSTSGCILNIKCVVSDSCVKFVVTNFDRINTVIFNCLRCSFEEKYSVETVIPRLNDNSNIVFYINNPDMNVNSVNQYIEDIKNYVLYFLDSFNRVSGLSLEPYDSFEDSIKQFLESAKVLSICGNPNMECDILKFNHNDRCIVRGISSYVEVFKSIRNNFLFRNSNLDSYVFVLSLSDEEAGYEGEGYEFRSLVDDESEIKFVTGYTDFKLSALLNYFNLYNFYCSLSSEGGEISSCCDESSNEPEYNINIKWEKDDCIEIKFDKSVLSNFKALVYLCRFVDYISKSPFYKECMEENCNEILSKYLTEGHHGEDSEDDDCDDMNCF